MPGQETDDVTVRQVHGADGEISSAADASAGEYRAGRTGRGDFDASQTGRGHFHARRTGRGSLGTSDPLSDSESKFDEMITDELPVAEQVRREQVDVEAHTRGYN